MYFERWKAAPATCRRYNVKGTSCGRGGHVHKNTTLFRRIDSDDGDLRVYVGYTITLTPGEVRPPTLLVKGSTPNTRGHSRWAPTRSDMHHLFPKDNVNSSRSNHDTTRSRTVNLRRDTGSAQRRGSQHIRALRIPSSSIPRSSPGLLQREFRHFLHRHV